MAQRFMASRILSPAVRYNSEGHEPLPARTLRFEPVLERAGALRRGTVRALPVGPRERHARVA